MSCLPAHGRITCTRCYPNEKPTEPHVSRDGNWCIKPNPLAWGSVNPKILVLGFSKGANQVAELEKVGHDETAFDEAEFNKVAFSRGRKNVGKILAHVGAIRRPENEDFEGLIDELIADKNGCYHFGSLVRCSVCSRDKTTGECKTSESRILDKFIDSDFADVVARNCVDKFLKSLPNRTKLVILFGLGTDLHYVEAVKNLIKEVRGGKWRDLCQVAYRDEDKGVTFVHVEHFKARSHISHWLGETGHERAKLGIMARKAVQGALKV